MIPAREDEHPAIREAREATRLPRWFPLAAIAVVASVFLLSGCGGGGGSGEDAERLAWQACRDTGWVPLQPTGSLSIGSRQQLPPGADGTTAAQANGALSLRLPAGATASANVTASLHSPGSTEPAATGQTTHTRATADAAGVAVLPVYATLPTGTQARTPAELGIQLQTVAAGGAITAWRLEWCAQGVRP